MKIPLRTRLRRPTIVLGSIVAPLGVALTATSFTWREHVLVQKANAEDLGTLESVDYPGAHALLDNAPVPDAPMRPTVLEAKEDLPETTVDGCISDFTNVDVITCSYGDKSATRTIALAGGSHAEHWITALDLLGKQHHFKVTTYLKMGCPLTTEDVPLVMGDNRPYPKCHTWNDAVMKKIIADRPDLRVHHCHPAVEHQARRRHAGHLCRDLANVVGQQYSDPGDARHAMAGAEEPAVLPRRLPRRRRQRHLVRDQTLRRAGGRPIPRWSGSNRFPLLKPLDLSDAVCRKDVCRAVEGNVLIYHDSHHISKTYMRTMADELGRQIGVATHWW